MGCGALSKISPHAIDVDEGRVIPEAAGKRSSRILSEEGLKPEKVETRRRSISPFRRAAESPDLPHGEVFSSESPKDARREAVGEGGDVSAGQRSPSPLGNASRRTSLLEGNKRRNVKDFYKLGKLIGKGGYAMVKHATSKATGEEFAIKIIRLPSLFHWKGTPREGIFKEVDLLLNMDHPNVVKLYDFFEDGSRVYLVMELLRGGELLTALMKRGTYTEDDARFCFRQIIEGIHYLHSHQIVHRDLKLENVLLVEKDNLTQVKIADFGFARQVQSSNMLSTICGTPIYVAPEVISNGKYTTAIDMWSAGIMLYILLGGYPPFYDESEPALYDLIRNTTYSFDDPAWNSVSKSAKNLIQKLLVANPAKRPAAADVLNHRWLNKDKGKTVAAEPEKNLAATMQRLKKHVALHKIRSAVKAIMWLNRLSNAVQLAERTRQADLTDEEKTKLLDRRTSLPATLLSASVGKAELVGTGSQRTFSTSAASVNGQQPQNGESSKDLKSQLRIKDLKRTRGSVGPPEILFAIGGVGHMESVTEQAEAEDNHSHRLSDRANRGEDDGSEEKTPGANEENDSVEDASVSSKQKTVKEGEEEPAGEDAGSSSKQKPVEEGGEGAVVEVGNPAAENGGSTKRSSEEQGEEEKGGEEESMDLKHTPDEEVGSRQKLSDEKVEEGESKGPAGEDEGSSSKQKRGEEGGEEASVEIGNPAAENGGSARRTSEAQREEDTVTRRQISGGGVRGTRDVSREGGEKDSMHLKDTPGGEVGDRQKLSDKKGEEGESRQPAGEDGGSSSKQKTVEEGGEEAPVEIGNLAAENGGSTKRTSEERGEEEMGKRRQIPGGDVRGLKNMSREGAENDSMDLKHTPNGEVAGRQKLSDKKGEEGESEEPGGKDAGSSSTQKTVGEGGEEGAFVEIEDLAAENGGSTKRTSEEQGEEDRVKRKEIPGGGVRGIENTSREGGEKDPMALKHTPEREAGGRQKLSD